MKTQKQSSLHTEFGKPTLCTSSDIIYKAFSRKADDNSAVIINLFASCSFQRGQIKLFFNITEKGEYELLQQIPRVTNPLSTYYTACFTPGMESSKPGKYVIIRDARGEHKVSVEPLR